MSHQKISFVKSGLRLAGYGTLGCTLYYLTPLFMPQTQLLGYLTTGLLIVSEVIGIVEEIGHE